MEDYFTTHCQNKKLFVLFSLSLSLPEKVHRSLYTIFLMRVTSPVIFLNPQWPATKNSALNYNFVSEFLFANQCSILQFI